MDWYKDFRLVEDQGEYTVVINLNPEFTEFSGEFGSDFKEKILNLDEQIRKFVKDKFSDIKVNTVKLLIGSMVVASIPFASKAVTTKAATVSSSSQQSATTKATVTASKLNVRSGPGTNYESFHTLWQGNVITVIGESNGWYKIQLSNGKTGWVSGTYLQFSGTTAPGKELSTTGTVTASKLNVRSGPGTSYSITHTLWQGNTIKISGESNGWYKIQLSNGTTGWVSSTYIKLGSTTATPAPSTPTTPTAPSREEKINTVISAAKSLIGTPYVWGGESLAEGGFDCSGLTYFVFKKVGINLNRVSADQAKQGTTVSKSNLQPGDLVFFSFQGTSNIDHVGIYIGNNKMIHSPKAGDTVKTTDISTSYWQSRFVTAKRML